MRYISTRGQAPALSFEDAMLTGLARDGGLYVPETIPTISKADIAAMAGLSYEEVAFRIKEQRVEILSVLHGRRNPSVWKDRSS